MSQIKIDDFHKNIKQIYQENGKTICWVDVNDDLFIGGELLYFANRGWAIVFKTKDDVMLISINPHREERNNVNNILLENAHYLLSPLSLDVEDIWDYGSLLSSILRGLDVDAQAVHRYLHKITVERGY
jgi:hypothetical protein